MDLCAVRGQADDLVSTRRPIRRAAFTLLEAVLALAILSSVLVVCLTVRAQSIAQRARLVERLADTAECEAIFESIVGGVLSPTRVDPTAGLRVWEGERAGRPYTVEAKREVRASPLASNPDEAKARFVTVWQYKVTVGPPASAITREFLWHR